jgi:hypothetical protein
VNDPKGRAQPARGQLMKKLILAAFPTFSIDIFTNFTAE